MIRGRSFCLFLVVVVVVFFLGCSGGEFVLLVLLLLLVLRGWSWCCPLFCCCLKTRHSKEVMRVNDESKLSVFRQEKRLFYFDATAKRPIKRLKQTRWMHLLGGTLASNTYDVLEVRNKNSGSGKNRTSSPCQNVVT